MSVGELRAIAEANDRPKAPRAFAVLSPTKSSCSAWERWIPWPHTGEDLIYPSTAREVKERSSVTVLELAEKAVP